MIARYVTAMGALLFAAAFVGPASATPDSDGWDGAGWYYVMDTPGGGFLSGGPYASADACKAVDRGMTATALDSCTYFSSKPTPHDLGQDEGDDGDYGY